VYFSFSFSIHCTSPCNTFPLQESSSGGVIKSKKEVWGNNCDMRRMVYDTSAPPPSIDVSQGESSYGKPPFFSVFP
jgi:hypothetical protein